MAENIRLKEIKIKGFRGYGREEVRIDLSDPVVLLYGGNRSGKSSTTNAVEWALYGGEVTGKKIGIAERKGWEARNRHCDSIGVELVLESDAGEIRVVREMGERKRSGESFYFVDENGEKHENQEELWSRLGMDARDFMSSAYLHQEVIRDIVVSEPRVREEALNRLLGISDLFNLSKSLKDIKKKSYEDAVSNTYERLQQLIKTKSSAYQETIDGSIEEGEALGMAKGDFTDKGFCERCSKACELVKGLAKKAGLEDPGLEPPEDTTDFMGFESRAKEAVRALRNENPAAVSQAALVEERGELDAALSEYRSKKERKEKLLEEKRELEKEGGQEDLERKKQELEERQKELEEELGRINTRLPVIEATVTYLERLEDKEGTTACPSCEQDIVPREVLVRLREVKAGMGEEASEKSGEKKELAESLSSLEETVERLRRIQEVELPKAVEEMKRCREKIGEILEREIGEDEDPESIANKRLEEIEDKLEKAKKLLQEYNREIDGIEDALKEARLIRDVLEAREKIAVIEKITESREWEEMGKTRAKLFQELEAAKKVKGAVDAVINELAGEKLRETEDAISSYYRALVERPDFESIMIDPEDHDVYAVSGKDKEKVIKFFNQGDMNCAALSIFLALGGSSAREGATGFLVLDDPSQSLDSEQKRKLAALIDRVAADRQVVLATMDEELLKALQSDVSKAKRVYRFGEWDPVKGPSIKGE